MAAGGGRRQRARWARLAALCLLAVCAAGAGGCSSVNAVSAVRLAGEAQLTVHAMSETLESTRRSMETFVEGQALHARLTGRAALSPSELCSIRAVQRSLRQRVLLLRKLVLLYDGLVALANYERDDNPAVFDEVIADLDRYELLPDATPGPTCPDPDPTPDPTLEQPGAVAAPGPSPPIILTQSSTLRHASVRIRAILLKFRSLWEREGPLYLSIQRRASMSQKTLTRSLFTKYGLLSPGAVFAPQVAGLGLDWDEATYRKQIEKWPADKQAALQESVLSILDHRADRRVAEEEARYVQQTELLRVLYRQHQVLEAGQPLDLRQLALYLVPMLGGVNSRSTSCTTQ